MTIDTLWEIVGGLAGIGLGLCLCMMHKLWKARRQ